jgi:hypothetical protein
LIGGSERAARVDVAVRAAAPALIEREQRVLAVLGAADGELELVATGHVELALPFTGSGTRWVLPSATPIELLAADARKVAPPCPTLVQLGVDEIGRDVYVDLEALEALEIGGPPDVADSIVAAVAATLAGSVFAEVTNLFSVAVPSDAFFGHRLHRSAADPVSALAGASAAIGSTSSFAAPTFELRARATAGEAWEPSVVLVGSGAGEFTAPANRRGLALVSAAPIIGPSSRLAPEAGWWVLRPLGVRLQPIGLVPDDLSALAELADVEPVSDPALDHRLSGADLTIYTDDEWSAPLDMSTPGGSDTDPSTQRAHAHATSHIDDWALLVKVLGPVAVVDRSGTTVEFERSKTRELVAWLATHRLRSTRGNARTALWDHHVRDATFANVVSEARRSMARLAPPPGGEEWLGRTLNDSLPLHGSVRTDAELVAAALDASRLQPPAMAIATLEPAVALVVGMPFEGTAYLWPDAEGLTSNLIVLAISATAELAAHHLSVGDLDGVFRATGRGLQVLPGHEQLIGLRMRAHAQAGDLAGVRHEWESYERTLDADPWSDGEPSPKLVELRQELLNPSR